MKEKMWFSKYALTDGLQEVEVEPSCAEGYAFPVGLMSSYKIGKHLHIEKEDAIKAAESDRSKKLISLKKQIDRLKAMKF